MSPFCSSRDISPQCVFQKQNYTFQSLFLSLNHVSFYLYIFFLSLFSSSFSLSSFSLISLFSICFFHPITFLNLSLSSYSLSCLWFSLSMSVPYYSLSCVSISTLTSKWQKCTDLKNFKLLKYICKKVLNVFFCANVLTRFRFGRRCCCTVTHWILVPKAFLIQFSSKSFFALSTSFLSFVECCCTRLKQIIEFICRKLIDL